jgi:hypothetical protein
MKMTQGVVFQTVNSTQRALKLSSQHGIVSQDLVERVTNMIQMLHSLLISLKLRKVVEIIENWS